MRDGIEHRQHLLGGILMRCATQPPERSPECELKTFLGYRLQEIIDCRDFERSDRILVVRGHEDDRGHAVRSNGVDDGESVGARHLHIEEHKVEFLLPNESNGFASVACFAD